MDWYFSSEYLCTLFSASLECDSLRDATEIKIGLTAFKPRSFLVKQVDVGITPQYIVAEDGTLYLLPPTFDQLKGMTDQSFEQTTNYDGLANLGIVSGLEKFGLTLDGKLLYSTHATDAIGGWMPAPALENAHFKKLIAPIWWSKEIESL